MLRIQFVLCFSSWNCEACFFFFYHVSILDWFRWWHTKAEKVGTTDPKVHDTVHSTNRTRKHFCTKLDRIEGQSLFLVISRCSSRHCWCELLQDQQQKLGRLFWFWKTRFLKVWSWSSEAQTSCSSCCLLDFLLFSFSLLTSPTRVWTNEEPRWFQSCSSVHVFPEGLWSRSCKSAPCFLPLLIWRLTIETNCLSCKISCFV